MNKIVSYLGFAKKSKNIITGQTALKRTKKKLHLILVCKTASDNLKNLAKNLANNNDCCAIMMNIELSHLINEENIKILALTDENLSKAIINNKEKISIG